MVTGGIYLKMKSVTVLLAVLLIAVHTLPLEQGENGGLVLLETRKHHVEAKPEPKPEPKPAPKPAKHKKPETKPAPKPEPKPEPKAKVAKVAKVVVEKVAESKSKSHKSHHGQVRKKLVAQY